VQDFPELEVVFPLHGVVSCDLPDTSSHLGSVQLGVEFSGYILMVVNRSLAAFTSPFTGSERAPTICRLLLALWM
jgi:hypothetical protein